MTRLHERRSTSHSVKVLDFSEQADAALEYALKLDAEKKAEAATELKDREDKLKSLTSSEAIEKCQKEIKLLEEKVTKNPPGSVRCEKGLGLVETPIGTFVICTEGVGSGPFKDDEDYKVEWWMSGEDTEDGKTSSWFGVFPFATQTFQIKELRELPVLNEVNLAEHIRTFGARLEGNYKLWAHAYDEAMEGRLLPP